jgi:hypothetical protein
VLNQIESELGAGFGSNDRFARFHG